jgi:hypothetical protein
MGWEERNGNRYYYRKRRYGRTVISEYCGSGWLAEIQATLDEIERIERKQAQQARRQVEAQTRGLHGDFNMVEDLSRALTRASMLLSGYHPHKGQWRKKRDG